MRVCVYKNKLKILYSTFSYIQTDVCCACSHILLRLAGHTNVQTLHFRRISLSMYLLMPMWICKYICITFVGACVLCCCHYLKSYNNSESIIHTIRHGMLWARISKPINHIQKIISWKPTEKVLCCWEEGKKRGGGGK